MSSDREGRPYLVLAIHGEETVKPPSVRGVANFLADLDRLHYLSRVAIHPQFEGFQFEDMFPYRYMDALRREERSSVIELRIASPLDLKTAIPLLVPYAISGVSLLLAMYQIVSTQHLNRQKLKLEIEKLRLDMEKTGLEVRKLQREEQVVLARMVQTQLPHLDDDHAADSVDPMDSVNVFDRLHRRGLMPRFQSIIDRLGRSEIRISEVDIEGIRRLTR